METSKGCKKLYLAPTLSLSFVEVEQGFATSETGGSGDWREDGGVRVDWARRN